jgi:beta-lactamase class D
MQANKTFLIALRATAIATLSLVPIALLAGTTNHVQTPEPAMQSLMQHYGHAGAFLLQSHTEQAHGEKSHVYFGQALADQPLPPASSFKVLLALIALEQGALTSAEEIVPWDGQAYPDKPEWQADMALKKAMQTSSESYFRVLAKRLGRAQLALWVKKVGYGNTRIGDDALSAWHDGILRVTAAQQLAFIERLRGNDLPFKRVHLDAVKATLFDSEVNGQRIYGKTGTHFDAQHLPGVGWWIGWVEASPKSGAKTTPPLSTSFVLQVQLQTLDERAARLVLARQLLRAAGVLH